MQGNPMQSRCDEGSEQVLFMSELALPRMPDPMDCTWAAAMPTAARTCHTTVTCMCKTLRDLPAASKATLRDDSPAWPPPPPWRRPSLRCHRWRQRARQRRQRPLPASLPAWLSWPPSPLVWRPANSMQLVLKFENMMEAARYWQCEDAHGACDAVWWLIISRTATCTK